MKSSSKIKFENMGAQMLREVARETSDVASTTATVLARYLDHPGATLPSRRSSGTSRTTLKGGRDHFRQQDAEIGRSRGEVDEENRQRTRDVIAVLRPPSLTRCAAVSRWRRSSRPAWASGQARGDVVELPKKQTSIGPTFFAAPSIFQSKQILQELRGAKKIRLKNRHMQNQ